jgi:hypothetical protein
MCKCTPNVRTPYCGAVGCEWPKEDGVKNLVKLEIKTDVKDTLKEVLDMSDSLSGVIVLGLTKESTQILRTSTMSAMEKSFLASFLNAWMTKWFELE